MLKLLENNKEGLALRIVFYLIGIFIVLFCLIQFNLYNYFDYHDFDLAIYNQVTWNTLHGNFFDCSLRGGAYFKDHLPLILLVFLPVYALFQSPLTLLFLQTIFLGLAAWPLFLLAKEKLGIKFALCITFLYLIYPAVGRINLFEFHYEVFSVFFLIFTFYFFIKDKFLYFVLFMIFALACKEDISLTVLMFGLYAALTKKSMRWALTPLISGLAWFIICIFIVIPYFNKGEYVYTVFYSHLGNTPLKMLMNIALHPIKVLKFMSVNYKLEYLLQLFLPVSFLSFLSPGILLIILPTLIRNLISAYSPTVSISCQYTLALVPFIFISAIYGLKKILNIFAARIYSTIIMAGILIIGIISSWILGPQLHLPDKISQYRGDYLCNTRNKFLAQVPIDASLTATFNFLPKLSMRRKLYTFHYIYYGREKVEKNKFILPSDTEYALIDFDDYLTFKGFYTPKGGQNLRAFLAEGKWGIVGIADNIALLKRGYVSEYKFYELLGQGVFKPGRKEVALTGSLGLMGYQSRKLDTYYGSVIYLSLYLRCIKNIPQDYRVLITISDLRGKVILQKSQQICYNIFPTSEWKAGEVVKSNYWIVLPLNEDLKDYRINLAILDRDGRWLPQVASNP